MTVDDLTDFRPDPSLADGVEVYLVVKSLDQRARRRRLVASKKEGRIGRIAARPTATGLLVRAALGTGAAVTAETARWTRPFREPRGLAPLAEGRYLLTEVGRVLVVDAEGEAERAYTHPYFAFLHDVVVSAEYGRFLVVSSGYDALFEVDLETGKVVWEWFGWEHGFNPTAEGTHLTRDAAAAGRLRAEGRSVRLIDPADYGEQGLVTDGRTTHPASAAYNPYRPTPSVLTTVGRAGQVVEIDQARGEATVRIEALQAMPHAIRPHEGGWIVTNTLAGELWKLDAGFERTGVVRLAGLGGKPPEMAEHEWLQAVLPLGPTRYAGIDANRGLVLFDTAERTCTLVPVDDDWCVQHLVVPESGR